MMKPDMNMGVYLCLGQKIHEVQKGRSYPFYHLFGSFDND